MLIYILLPLVLLTLIPAVKYNELNNGSQSSQMPVYENLIIRNTTEISQKLKILKYPVSIRKRKVTDWLKWMEDGSNEDHISGLILMLQTEKNNVSQSKTNLPICSKETGRKKNIEVEQLKRKLR